MNIEKISAQRAAESSENHIAKVHELAARVARIAHEGDYLLGMVDDPVDIQPNTMSQAPSHGGGEYKTQKLGFMGEKAIVSEDRSLGIQGGALVGAHSVHQILPRRLESSVRFSHTQKEQFGSKWAAPMTRRRQGSANGVSSQVRETKTYLTEPSDRSKEVARTAHLNPDTGVVEVSLKTMVGGKTRRAKTYRSSPNNPNPVAIRLAERMVRRNASTDKNPFDKDAEHGMQMVDIANRARKRLKGIEKAKKRADRLHDKGLK